MIWLLNLNCVFFFFKIYFKKLICFICYFKNLSYIFSVFLSKCYDFFFFFFLWRCWSSIFNFLLLTTGPRTWSGLCWSSVLASDDGSDTGAAHGDQVGLQAVVVALHCPWPRLFWLDAAQQQHLAHDGSGLQVLVLPPLQGQTAAEQTVRLRHHRDQRVIFRDAEYGEREGTKL